MIGSTPRAPPRPRCAAARNAGTRSCGARPHDAAHVQGVAHLAVERVPHREARTARRRRVVGGHQPRAAGAVQADRHAVLAGHGPELGDRRARAAGDGQRQPLVGEQRPAGGVRGAVDQLRPRPAGRPAAASAGTTACVMIARAVPSASLPMRNTTVLPVRSTPVASANTFGRPSNTNPTTPSGSRHCCDGPLPRAAPRRPAASGGGDVAPRAQPGDHVGAHRRRQLEATGRAARGRGAVARRPRWPRRSAAKTVSSARRRAKRVEELR